MVPHDLVIDELNVKQDLATEPRSIRFTPTKPGKYAIYCSKKPPLGGASHRERGMEGVLEVVN
jgi:heme/copper-type cytochrome/quinol oxidase subunit 2